VTIKQEKFTICGMICIRPFIAILLSWILLWPVPNLQAQEFDPTLDEAPFEEPLCRNINEKIVKLRPADFYSSMTWMQVMDNVNGYSTIAPSLVDRSENQLLEEPSYILAGLTPSENKVIFNEMNARGQEMWRTPIDSKNKIKIIKLLPLVDAGSYVALAQIITNKRTSGLQLIFINKDGKIIQRPSIMDQAKQIIPTDIAYDTDQKSFYIVGYTVGHTKDAQSKSFIYKTNKDGKIIWQRYYNPGIDNKLYSLRINNKNEIIIAGEITNITDASHTKIKTAGWLIKINSNGNMIWNRSYPRGTKSSFTKLHHYKDGFVLLGQSTPFQQDNTPEKPATWLMRIHQSGDINWQRYYQMDGSIQAIDITANDDGMIYLLSNAQKKLSQQQKRRGIIAPHYIRLMHINPLGHIHETKNYRIAEGVKPVQLFKDNDRHLIIIGKTRVMPLDYNDQSDKDAYNGMIFSTAPLPLSIDEFNRLCQ